MIIRGSRCVVKVREKDGGFKCVGDLIGNEREREEGRKLLKVWQEQFLCVCVCKVLGVHRGGWKGVFSN